MVVGKAGLPTYWYLARSGSWQQSPAATMARGGRRGGLGGKTIHPSSSPPSSSTLLSLSLYLWPVSPNFCPSSPLSSLTLQSVDVAVIRSIVTAVATHLPHILRPAVNELLFFSHILFETKDQRWWRRSEKMIAKEGVATRRKIQFQSVGRGEGVFAIESIMINRLIATACLVLSPIRPQ